MTEEIIKECEFYLPLSEDCNEILDDNGNEIYKCSKRQDCYYKQLKRLEQENKELKQVRKDLPDIQMPYVIMYRQVKKECHELEKENKELKNILKPYKHPDVVTLLTKWRTGELDRIHNKIANERDAYRSALDTIQRMVLSAWEQGKYLDGGLYNDLINEFNKINEVLTP